MSVLKKYNKETEAGRIVPNDKQKQNTSDALTQFRKTDFDLEDRAPFGGPINSPQHGFAQKYTPNKTFTDSDEGAIRGRGKFRQEKSIFRETSFTKIDKIIILIIDENFFSSVSTLLLKAILVKDSKKITLKMKKSLKLRSIIF